MKKLFALLFGAALLAGCSAIGLETDKSQKMPMKLSVQEALKQGKEQQLLDGSVKFYFSGQSHPAVSATLARGIVSNKKSNNVGKSNEDACYRAMLSALIQFQQRALNEGGNAVINLESYYRKNSFKSSTQFECQPGTLMAGVALKGDVVKLK